MPRKSNVSRSYTESQEFSIEEEDHNAWAVSYGDMVSVLLTFFILLLSFSAVNPNKFEDVKKNLESTKKKTSVEELESKIKSIVEENNLQQYLNVTRNELGVDINIRNEILFSEGEANLTPRNIRIMNELITSFKGLPEGFRFEIEGHTDDIPINNRRYPSNWYLSTDRALSVLNLFLRSDFDPKRLKVQGLADTSPLKPLRDENGNPIAENRKLNRRVLIKVR